jgi:hypothetical protein
MPAVPIVDLMSIRVVLVMDSLAWHVDSAMFDPRTANHRPKPSATNHPASPTTERPTT